jgi:predicted Zn-dependent protease
MKKLMISLFALPMLVLASGCSGDPVQTAAVDEHEKQYGAEQHEQLLQQFGGAYAGPESQYLKQVGEKLAQTAGLEGDCTFSLVNTDVTNAFAVPGCYIYVTRGLMGLMNSEDELASVLAHELGHIVADHSEQQQQRSLLRQLGVVAVALVTDSPALTRIAGGAAQLFTLRYSRTHEHEADDFAVKMLVQSNYNPFAAADMLNALGRYEAFHQASGAEIHAVPEWGRTHPLTDRRIERVREAAKAAGSPAGSRPEQESPFLEQVDGLLYGDDPEQGYVRGRSFAHPGMRIAFDFPESLRLVNNPAAIQIEGADGLRGEFSGGRAERGLDAYAEAVLGQFGDARVQTSAVERVTINRLPATIHELRLDTGQGTLNGLLAVVSTGGSSAYHFLLVAAPGKQVSPDAMKMVASFRRLSETEATRLRPRYIDVVAVRDDTTAKTLSGLMVSDRPLEHFLVLNGRSEDETVKAGTRVKIVRLQN